MHTILWWWCVETSSFWMLQNEVTVVTADELNDKFAIETRYSLLIHVSALPTDFDKPREREKPQFLNIYRNHTGHSKRSPTFS